ncbi:MAG TPA: energy transducer TonB [Allosphingosinicella sp.]|nr:energy transducer TonB [Allosphingosinicella sp.]
MLATLALQSPAGAEETKRAAPFAPLHTYLSADDYPAEAIAKGEHGTVHLRLSIGIEGRVRGCTIIESSGSAVLDATSCRIMVARPRFHPATDAGGKPVQDSFESKIRWRIPTAGTPVRMDVPAGVNMATSLWFACTSGEAAKLVPTDLPAPDVARRAFEACRPLEERIAAEMTAARIPALAPAKLIPTLKEQVSQALPQFLEKSRSELRIRSAKP